MMAHESEAESETVVASLGQRDGDPANVDARLERAIGLHMFVFTRRAMQNMLDDIALWMPEGPLTELLGRLNTARSNRLPQMWELVWLYALGAVLPIQHERPLPNGKPDLWFSVLAGSGLVPVVADITTLSDSALDRANPFDQLTEAMHEQARKAGMQGGGFYVTASHLEAGVGGAPKVQLLIPTGPAFEQLVKRHLKPFARRVAGDPATPNVLEIDEPGAKFTVEYRGPSEYSGGSHRVYDNVLDLEKNVLFNRLNDKTRQLRGAPEGAVRMLVVCDGDCALLARDHPLEGFGAQQIAEHFLRGSQTVDLVLLVTVAEDRALSFAYPARRYLRCNLVAAAVGRPAHLTADVVKAVTRVFEAAIEQLPEPRMMPNNAFRRNFDAEWSASMEGGIEQRGDQIKVSARAVLELLAGAMTYERFAEVHRWTEGQFNMFESRLASGHLFESAKIEQLGTDQDDDWLVFEFGAPDPAISPFRLPKRSEDVEHPEPNDPA